MTNEQLLAEVEEVIRDMPPRQTLSTRIDDVEEWLGRATAVVKRWKPRDVRILFAMTGIQSLNIQDNASGATALLALLREARADLRMEVGVTNIVLEGGRVFDYFDNLRRIIETARTEVLFADPYLDAEFVPRYLPHVAQGASIRLLAGKRIPTLMPAVELFAKQSKALIEVRASKDIHDRYLFVDRSACYLSGASFKDGAKAAPTTLTQITDAFEAMWDTYEKLWNGAKVVWP